MSITLCLDACVSRKEFVINDSDNPQQSKAYEGFGAITKGALDAPNGYETYHVTSLADDGNQGTFRDAVSQGSRYIVFDVGGTITLVHSLHIFYSYITIDGSSAPNPGITILQPQDIGGTFIEAVPNRDGPISDIVIHHLRMDGQTAPGTSLGNHDIWGIDGETALVSRVMIDHVTAIAADDSIFDITGVVRDVTISWNLIMDTEIAQLLRATKNERISLHHNVYARNNEKQVMLNNHNHMIDYVNNIVYGWGWIEGGASGLCIENNSDVSNEEYPTMNVENNIFHYVKGLPGDNVQGAIFRAIPGKIYFNGNITPDQESDDYSTSTKHEIPAHAKITMDEAHTLGDTVVPFVGTHFPTQAEQDLLDKISNDVKQGR